MHVDDFLYDEDEVDELVAKGQLEKYYCGACGSKDIKSLVFITHSMSLIQVSKLRRYSYIKNQTAGSFRIQEIIFLNSRIRKITLFNLII